MNSPSPQDIPIPVSLLSENQRFAIHQNLYKKIESLQSSTLELTAELYALQRSPKLSCLTEALGDYDREYILNSIWYEQHRLNQQRSIIQQIEKVTSILHLAIRSRLQSPLLVIGTI